MVKVSSKDLEHVFQTKGEFMKILNLGGNYI